MVEKDAGDDRAVFGRSTELPTEDSALDSDSIRTPSTGSGVEILTPAPGGPPRDVRWLGADDPRYAPGSPLGQGGMGEVVLCRDHAVGRDVAMKLIRDRHYGGRRDLQERFVREARVQGQLEHPSIVPVYDVGVNAGGALYFTMKHVRGKSLHEVLRGLRAGDAELAARYSRRRLLTLLSQICLAVHFAHDKGVVHRDLKPANVMLGDFGEAYVLDWGLALTRDADTTGGTGIQGTPGYMAPEQVDPELARDGGGVDARADVYALGAILFEVLSLERLHGQDTLPEVLHATLSTDGARPSQRGAEVPLELDELCHRATRRDRRDRLASAQELSAAIEAFLDGDRDLALRRRLAEDHAGSAEQALARAHQARGAEGEQVERALAMREVASALGLDPTHRGARTTLVRLIAEPVTCVPAEAEAQLRASALGAYQLAARAALVFYACYLLYLPLLLWMGVRDRGLFALGWVTIAMCATATYALLRRPPARLDRPLLHLALSTFTVATVSVLFGPYILVPMLAVAMCVSYTASVGHARGLVPLASCLAVIAPAVLGWLGLAPQSYSFADGRWTVLPVVFEISPVATQVFLIVASIGTIAPACVFVARLRRAYLDAQRRLQLQAWQLQQIVPE
jgi:hypothetical protein